MLCRDPRPRDTATPCRTHLHRCNARVPAVHASPLRAPRPSRWPGLRTMSRHRKLCCDIVPGRPYRDEEFLYRDTNLVLGSSLPFFLSYSHPIVEISYYCIYTHFEHILNLGKAINTELMSPKISFYYKTSRVHLQNWIFYLEYYKNI